MMHRAAALPNCAWGLDYEEGIELRSLRARGADFGDPGLPAARNRFEDGHDADAIDDLVDAMTLGRHASLDGGLITVLVHYAIEAVPAKRSRSTCPGSTPR